MMNYVVCRVPVAPVRIEPDHRSEMINQLLFGGCCTICIADKNGWIKIENKLDGYTGWCSRSHFEEIDEAIFNQPSSVSFELTAACCMLLFIS